MKKLLLAAAFSLVLILMAFSSAQAQTTPILWGVTHAGGAVDTAAGTIFRLNGDGTGFSSVINFNDNAPGGTPDYVQLLMANDGKFYGTTYLGGTNSEGIIFSLNPSTGNYQVLHNFNDTAGAFPFGSLIQASNGKLYGMTNAGGANNYGIIFSYDAGSNTFADVFDLDSITGSSPYGNLFQAANGKLYGLTSAGGANDYGVLFSFDPASNTYHDLYDFIYATGSTPFGGLMQTADGLLYGTASVGGGSNYYGTLFSFDTSSNTFTDVFDFNDTLGMGVTPYGNLVAGPGNLLYGLTAYGGSSYTGVIFSFNPSSKVYTTLFNFNDSIGSIPHGNLTLAGNGSFYGETAYGGANNLGTVFRFNPNNNEYKKLFDFDSTTGFIPFGSLSIQGSATTAISQPSVHQNAPLQLYPNPAVNYTTVNITEDELGGSITVTDVTGKQVINLSVNSLTTSLPLTGLASGAYTVTVRSKSGLSTGVLIKE
jgi:uncharacterized repeat protein (TIGR03803 family)